MSGKIIVLLFLLLGTWHTNAQTASDLQLAQYYYNNSELDKAVGYFEKVYALDQSKAIFLPYYECLLAQKDFKTAEKLLRKQIALNKQDYEVRLMAGQFYEEQNDPTKAKKIFEELLGDIGPNPGVGRLPRLFSTTTRHIRAHSASSWFSNGPHHGHCPRFFIGQRSALTAGSANRRTYCI
jgi:tetratricopeptide (TPR) repeat protein